MGFSSAVIVCVLFAYIVYASASVIPNREAVKSDLDSAAGLGNRDLVRSRSASSIVDLSNMRQCEAPSMADFFCTPAQWFYECEIRAFGKTFRVRCEYLSSSHQAKCPLFSANVNCCNQRCSN